MLLLLRWTFAGRSLDHPKHQDLVFFACFPSLLQSFEPIVSLRKAVDLRLLFNCLNRFHIKRKHIRHIIFLRSLCLESNKKGDKFCSLEKAENSGPSFSSRISLTSSDSALSGEFSKRASRKRCCSTAPLTSNQNQEPLWNHFVFSLK